MLGPTLVDHLRLTFGHVIYTHRAHAQLAARYARWNRLLQGAEAFLMLATAVTSVALLTSGEIAYAVASAIAAGLAVSILLVRLVLDLDKTVDAHRACSAHLWHIREQYRALLADLNDGTLTLEHARERRDALMRTLYAIYEKAPAADRAAYESARRAVPAGHEAVLSEAEIDRFLPESLQKGDRPAA
jgi:hypothetical protein